MATGMPSVSRKPPARPSVPRIFDGEKEARLIALACSKPPEGHARWSLRLLYQRPRRLTHGGGIPKGRDF